MPSPLSTLRRVHEAIRRAIRDVHEEARTLAGGGDGDPEALSDRFADLRRVLVAHEMAEEAVLFPALEAIAPESATAYEIGHRELDTLSAAVAEALVARDIEELSRATAAVRALVALHMDKEEQHLLTILETRLSEDEQHNLMRRLGERLLAKDLAANAAWIITELQIDGRAELMRSWRHSMLPTPYADVVAEVRRRLGPRAWEELLLRVPEMRA